MTSFEHFLQHLNRPEASELILQSDAVAAVSVSGKLQPLTRERLNVQHIIQLIQPTPLISVLPRKDGVSAPTATQANGVWYVATVARSGAKLEVRVRKDRPSRPVAAAKARPNRVASPESTAIAHEGPRAAEPGSVADPGAYGELPDERPAANPWAANVAPSPAVPGEARALLETGEPSASGATAAREAEASVPRRPAEPKHAPLAPVRASVRPSVDESSLPEFVPVDQPVAAPAALVKILVRAYQKAASDVHIMSDEPARLRCFGRLCAEGAAISDSEVRAMLMPLLNERNAAQLSELGYADFACQVQGVGRLRVNVGMQRTGLKGSFRLIMAEPPTLESLGLPKELRQILNYHQGLVVISGPNGAGKTTTLAALVDLFNAEKSVHIITVEDPVEVIHPTKKAIVSQREVGSHTKSFHAALKGSLREDPDVIAIGELRDRETVEKALEAAETGHLVFATMSTPSGASTIDRLIDMFPPDDQSQVRATLAGALKFVVSQRLAERADGKGRVAAVELLTGNIALWNLIKDDKLFQLPSLLQRGRAFGMIRIEDSLKELLSAGTITMETAKALSNDPRALVQRAEPQPAPDPSAPQDNARGLGRFKRKGG